MNTHRDTDKRKARPSVWPVYVAAVVLVPVGVFIGLVGVAPFMMTVFAGGVFGGGAEDLAILSAFGLIAAMGPLGLAAAVGLSGLRPWGWWCTAIFAGGWAMVSL